MDTTSYQGPIKVHTISSTAFSPQGWQTVCNGCEIVVAGKSSILLRRFPAFMRACHLSRKQTKIVVMTRRGSWSVFCIRIHRESLCDQQAWTYVTEVQLGCQTAYAFEFGGRAYAWFKRDSRSTSIASGQAIEYWTLVQLENPPTTTDDDFFETEIPTSLALYAQPTIRPSCGKRSIQFFERLAPDLILTSTAIAVQVAADDQGKMRRQMYSDIYKHMAALGL